MEHKDWVRTMPNWNKNNKKEEYKPINLFDYIISTPKNEAKFEYKLISGKLPFGWTVNKRGVIYSWQHKIVNQPFFGDKTLVTYDIGKYNPVMRVRNTRL